MSKPLIQPKLKIGAPNDKYEREADRVADQVMRMPEPGAVQTQNSPLQIQRVCSECEEKLQRQTEEEEEEELIQAKPIIQRQPEEKEEEELIQNKAGAGQTPQLNTETASQIQGLRGRGQALDSSTRAFMEPRFGQDFSQVRVHADNRAADLARSINARAFTVGRDVVFGRGEYAPRKMEGKRLLGHELAHVVQQSVAPTTSSLEVGASDNPGERVATHVGNAVIAGAQERPLHPEPTNLRRKATQPDDEMKRLERASARGRSLGIGSSTRHMIAGAEIVYRLIGEFFPAFEDSITAVSIGEALFHAKVVPSKPGGKLNGDAGFRIIVSPEFLGKRLHLQVLWLKIALQQLRTVSGPGSYKKALKQSAAVVGRITFGSLGGLRAAEQDAEDAYDASAWEDVGLWKLRSKIEPWRAMIRLVDKADQEVPKAGGGTTHWNFGCFDAVVFNHLFGQWKTMSRFQFNQRYFPLEIGRNSRYAKPESIDSEWYDAIRSDRPGGPRYVQGKVRMPTGVAGDYAFEEPKVPVQQDLPTLLHDAPVGTQIIWTNLDAQKRCIKDSNLSFCASWQNENAIKVGRDEYAAHPFGIRNEQYIVRALAEATYSELKGQPPLEEYIRKNIYISALRRPKR